MVKLKDIPFGVMIEKKDPEGKDFCTVGYTVPFNDAIEEQGSVEIGLNRERLAAFLYTRKIKNYRVPTAEDILEVTAESYYEADALISAESTLFERKGK